MSVTWSNEELRGELEVVVTAGAKLSENADLQQQIPNLLALVELKWPGASTYSDKADWISKVLEEALASAAGSSLSDDQEKGYRILFGIRPESRGMAAAVRRDDAATYLAPPRAPRRTETGRRQSEISGASMWARRRNEVLQPVVDALAHWKSEHDRSSDSGETGSRSLVLLREILISFSSELATFMKVRTFLDEIRHRDPPEHPEWTLDDWIQDFAFPNHHTHRGLSTDNLLYKFALILRLLRDLNKRGELEDALALVSDLLLDDRILGSLGNEDLADALGSPKTRSRSSFLETLEATERGRDLSRRWTESLKDGWLRSCWELNLHVSLLAGLLGSQRPQDQRIVSYCAEQDYLHRRLYQPVQVGEQLKDLMASDQASGWEFSNFAIMGMGLSGLDALDRKIERLMESLQSD